jgi:hypothetical protein
MSVFKRYGTFGPILYGLVVIVSVLVLDRAVAAAMGTLLLYSDDRAARIYAGGRADDVAIIGTSVGNAMANPAVLSDQTGRRVFMMAIHGLDPYTQDALVRDYVALNAPPRLALIEVRSARLEAVQAKILELYARPATHVRTLLDQKRETYVPWDSIFHLYRFNSPELAQAVKNLVIRNDQASGRSNGRITPGVISAWRRGTNIDHVDPQLVDAFVSTVSALRMAGTIPVVVIAPMHPSGRYQAQIMRSDVVSRLPSGILVCDFADYLDDDRYFEDPAHLNDAGRAAIAPLFDALIANQIGRGPSANTENTEAASRAVADRCRPRPAASLHA